MEKKSKGGEEVVMMTKLKKLTAVLIAAIFCITFIEPATALDKESIVERVQTAFEKQVSLSEKPRTMEEIHAILDTHFTDSFKDKFLLENVIETEEGFQTFGSDFAAYYIPNFSYSDKTKAVKKGETVYLVEYFTYEEGPVYFEDGYQGVKLTEENGELKVEDIFFTLPNELEGEAEREVTEPAENPQNVQTAKGENHVAPLSFSYVNKQYRIFQGYFLDDVQSVTNLI
ncbi:DUF3993 domain-containing protein [Bacillus sp. SG-1]|uniref:DUF3993 domain-containing protein n=1 Tax=Bacillus sp. SG-1 TaxID=161544 RepID=UPI00015432B4|nr:DUF3993 domain-containing protein [Bacillus sp. SG-1]EDL65059.1 hypothetical protein BSG1_07014 [Bacillus sp. SG-1]